MSRYFIYLSYCGAEYHGWQRQPGDMSVQQRLEECLSMVMRYPIEIVGAGRTDAGVNAHLMVAHFDAHSPIADIQGLIRSLNSVLPASIAISDIKPVTAEAHARFDATSRTYKYFAVDRKSPFLHSHMWRMFRQLDINAMNMAAQRMMQYTDFTSFSKLHTDVKTNICHITHAQWVDMGDYLVFTITADRFLRNMVRAIVGTLVDVGTHKISIDDFCTIIEHKNRCAAGTSMPGHALYLWDITYPDTLFL